MRLLPMGYVTSEGFAGEELPQRVRTGGGRGGGGLDTKWPSGRGTKQVRAGKDEDRAISVPDGYENEG